MRRIVLFRRPEVTVPLYALIAAVASGCTAASGFILYLGKRSVCSTLPWASATFGLFGLLPWSLRARPRPLNFGGRSSVLVVGAIALCLAVESIRCQR